MDDFSKLISNFEQLFDEIDDCGPEDIGGHLVKIGRAKAEAMFAQMDDEEAISMVRSFVECMMKWQPSIDESDHTLGEESTEGATAMCIGINALAISELFQMAFIKAYDHSDRKVKAMEAIDKAFGFE